LQSFYKPSKSRFNAVGVCHHVGSELSIIPAKFAYQIADEKWFKRHFFLKKLAFARFQLYFCTCNQSTTAHYKNRTLY